MADKLDGGVEDNLEFVNPIPLELEIYCSICLDVLNEPHLTQCCGHHFCLGCFEAVKRKHKPCPLCKDTHLKAVLNKGLRRTINGLKVYCPYTHRGCKWQGEMKDLATHLQRGEREGECLHVPIACINGCGETLEREVLRQHENELCTMKPHIDPLDMARKLQTLVIENDSLKDTVTMLKKANMNTEQVVDSLKQQVQSCLSDVALLKQQMLAIADKDTSKLQDLLKKFPPDVSHGATGVSPDSALRVVPYEFIFDNFSRRCENPELWFCLPFYTHNNGYKMCIRVAPQGLGNGEATHVSVHSYLMKGEYDDMLLWPFRCAITLQLLNQIGSDCHHEQTSDFNDRTPEQYCRRVIHVERAGQGWGKSLFIAKSELNYDASRQVQYLKDDCLKFRVVSVLMHD